MKKAITLFIFSAFAISCKKEAKADIYIDQSTGSAPVAAGTPETLVPSLVPNNLTASTPVAKTAPPKGSSQAISVNPQFQSQQNTRNPNANPSHGQPRHRCDIPVGAPLNSAPTQKIQTAPQQEITQSTVPMPAQPIKTPPGMNPPHGQSGHRCDIAVGAPLNSPAQKPQPSTEPVRENTTKEVDG